MSNPRVARNPPIHAVCLIPYLSAKTPAKAKIPRCFQSSWLDKMTTIKKLPESKNVAPTVIDPIEEAFVEAVTSTSSNFSWKSTK
jgi:hypothetical protein